MFSSSVLDSILLIICFSIKQELLLSMDATCLLQQSAQEKCSRLQQRTKEAYSHEHRRQHSKQQVIHMGPLNIFLVCACVAWRVKKNFLRAVENIWSTRSQKEESLVGGKPWKKYMNKTDAGAATHTTSGAQLFWRGIVSV